MDRPTGYVGKASTRRQVLPLLTLVTLLCIATRADALNTIGTSRGTFIQILAVQGCGTQREQFRLNLTLKSARRWSATSRDGTFTGSFTQDAARKNLVLTFHAASKNRMIRNLRNWASDICGLPVTVRSVNPIRIKLRIGRPSKVANGTMTISGSGSTSQGSGTARYRATYSGNYRGN